MIDDDSNSPAFNERQSYGVVAAVSVGNPDRM